MEAFCEKLLCDLGMEGIKVEPPGDDGLRRSARESSSGFGTLLDKSTFSLIASHGRSKRAIGQVIT